MSGAGRKTTQTPMVRFYRRQYPEVGELVVGTVKSIEEHGAYITLDEYGGIEAYVPINEVLQSWFRNIRDYLKVGSKAVFKVIRVDPRRGLIDLSLRRVRDEERERKFNIWKRNLKAIKLMEIIAQKMGVSLSKLMEEAGWSIMEYYGDLYSAFEDAAKGNIDPLIKLGIRKELIDEVVRVANERIEKPKVTIVGMLRMINLRPNGVEYIRKILDNAIDEAKKLGVEAKIYVIGPPRYRIEVTGSNPRHVEEAFERLSSLLVNEAKANGGEASVSRSQ
ncbi:translation initiation factor IF-2 subunit alpha [Caldivirga sp. UBA161]|uniref:translation initiation factor IF-2 subunit alpha n=1 Tax=Caldivirga sp. UBA161 TaxID=1915569 RepID=UPI0025C004BB|nr:translation initiation factor IF-2 subunit alpha [Caldivirga sp. UBA161]